MKVGVLGTGDISHAFMVAAEIADVITEAVYHREIEKAVKFQNRYNISKAYDDYDEFLADDSFDTVYVGLPNGLHYQYGMKALEHDKNAILEKPFCSNVREFNELLETANRKGKFVIEMDRVQSLPNFKSMKDHLKDIGPVSVASANYSQYSRKFDAYINGTVGNVFTTKFSGGALMDLGVYPVNAFIALFGMPKKVSYNVTKLPTGVDISGTLLMEYENFNATVIVSKNSIGNKHIMIQGERGSILTETAPSVIEDLKLITRKEITDISCPQPYDGFAYTLIDIRDIIDNKDMEHYSRRLKQTKSVVTVLEYARKSAGIVFEADENIY
ncbi:MAG: Gfo/Idh/MocA family oxidoreductase [Erysipelotrichaceae bacterium]|nr:Gfo/Idh/MocA family oxidoreductase [Erysipelotrichaceae bacterium]